MGGGGKGLVGMGHRGLDIRCALKFCLFVCLFVCLFLFVCCCCFFVLFCFLLTWGIVALAFITC